MRVDKIGFFKEQRDNLEDYPLFTISVQDIKRIDKLGPKKNGLLICMRCTESDHYFYSEKKENMLMWVEKIERWIGFKNVFGPIRLISRSRTLAHFALAAKETKINSKLSSKAILMRMSTEQSSSDMLVINDHEIDKIANGENKNFDDSPKGNKRPDYYDNLSKKKIFKQ